MGFFDRDVKNSFDRMFDWNDDGKLNSFEQANQFEFEQRMPVSCQGRRKIIGL